MQETPVTVRGRVRRWSVVNSSILAGLARMVIGRLLPVADVAAHDLDELWGNVQPVVFGGMFSSLGEHLIFRVGGKGCRAAFHDFAAGKCLGHSDSLPSYCSISMRSRIWSSLSSSAWAPS